MNVLHISRTMGQGGAEKVVYQICSIKDNNKMFVASTGGSLGEQLDKMGVPQIQIPDIDNKNLFSILKTLFILKKTVIKYKIDIIHSHHRMAAFYSRIVCLFNPKIKRVYTAHNVFFNKKKLLRFSLKGSKIIAVGDGVKNNLINVYNIDENDIEIIYNSIEKPEKIQKPNDDFIKEKNDKKYIATIGRLSEQKGIDVFIKALAPIIKINKNVYGIIIGDGELRNELIQLTKKLKIEDNIVFLGYRNDVLELISCMDFIVLSSRWEGFPLTPIETFAMKKTIIVSNIDGNNEIVKNGVNGFLFEKDNIDELTKKISYLLNLNKNQMEQNAYNDYMDKFSFKSFINNYFDVYERINNEKNI